MTQLSPKLAPKADNLEKSLPESDLLEVKKSTISDAGLGLFARQLIPKGTVFCEYYGRELTLLQMMRLKDKTYVMGGFGLNCHIDAQEALECFGRYINDGMDPERQNARFVKIKHLKRANVFSIRDIQPGEEIFASYGCVYWRGKQIAQGHLG